MKTFKLINKNGEAINRFKSDSLEESIEYFSEVKKLTKKLLLSSGERKLILRSLGKE